MLHVYAHVSRDHCYLHLLDDDLRLRDFKQLAQGPAIIISAWANWLCALNHHTPLPQVWAKKSLSKSLRPPEYTSFSSGGRALQLPLYCTTFLPVKSAFYKQCKNVYKLHHLRAVTWTPCYIQWWEGGLHVMMVLWKKNQDNAEAERFKHHTQEMSLLLWAFWLN